MLPYPSKSSVMDRRWKPSVEQAPNCPRCDSSNTKFCYYNNYSLAQPRYFCKGCRRYWTKGGSLRNVPVGGGCRKNQRGKSVRISTDHIRPIITSADHSDPNSIRPDLLLDDPSSRPPSRGSRAVPSVVVDVARSEGSDIDLALLYSKFLNPGQLVAPELMPVLELDGGNSFALAGASDCQIPVHLTQEERSVVDRQRSSGRITGVELCNGLQPSNGDFSCLDPNRNSTSSEVAILPSEEEEAVDDIFWSNCSNITWQTTSQNQAFGSIHQEDHMMIPRFHPNPNWNSTFDLSSYEAFTRP